MTNKLASGLKGISSVIRITSRPRRVILVGLFLVLGALIWLGVSRSLPTPADVFWDTIELNLQTKSLKLAPSIHLHHARRDGQLTLLDSQISFNFRPETQLEASQASLIYHQHLSDYYINPQQATIYQDIGLPQPPEAEWLYQDVRNLDNQAYFRHRLETQPAFEEYARYLDRSQSQELAPWGGAWYKPPLAGLDYPQLSNLQLYWMTAVSTSGFLFGYIEDPTRQPILENLRLAYNVDFDNMKTYRLDGRLMYEYQFTLNYDEFSRALVAYHDSHIRDYQQKAATILTAEGQSVLRLRPQPTVYTVVIDADARQIVSVSHDYAVPFVAPYLSFSSYNDFVLVPYSSVVIQSLAAIDGVELEVRMIVSDYNQRLDIDQPRNFQTLPSP